MSLAEKLTVNVKENFSLFQFYLAVTGYVWVNNLQNVVRKHVKFDIEKALGRDIE